MNPLHNYRMPLKYTIKPAVFKPKRSPSSSNRKYLSKLLYCVAHKTEEGKWEAHINTRGLDEYEDITILPFTEKSLELKGRRDIFLHHKDKTNHWVRIMRSQLQADISPGNPEVFCSLCDGNCFSGHIVKIEGELQFELHDYKGVKSECYSYLTRNNKKENEEE